jgi:cellobiose-specific phosphotransferase system component IIB
MTVVPALHTLPDGMRVSGPTNSSDVKNRYYRAFVGGMSTSAYWESMPEQIQTKGLEWTVHDSSQSALEHDVTNNNNTFTWSGPNGVFGCIGQRPVGPLVALGAQTKYLGVTVVTLCH